MLEYWMQVEIYHAVEKGQAGNWRHLGYYEQPYYTSTPLSGSKTNIKWVDLVFVSPNLEKPKRIIWIELKDLGRSTDRIISNAKVLGHDLAALYHLNTVETKRVWMTPHLMW